ncbi:MAG: ASPIC/UnbV domain-containing protein [Planctomycetes bacterium]|nr:ASPIC/UnbV domain-containing protein [Planctomycetota bacterium]MCB9871058.1 ASPIC/UnbV domain-containing protein [Planctomycetota bacterium]
MEFVEGVGRRTTFEDSDIVGWVKVGNNSLNGNENNVLLRSLGRSPMPAFVDAGYVSGADRIEDSRGVAAIDIEGDGDLDLIVQGVERPTVLLVNQGCPGTHWLQVRLRGTRSNRDAIGARIEVRIGERMLVREVTSTAGFISGRSLMSHFGLGGATKVDSLTVHWPRGGSKTLTDVAVDQRLTIVE